MSVVAVAYSGGRDSTALLHATLATASACGCRVVAFHVHHGLNPAADDWLAHCAEQCRRWTSPHSVVEFFAHRLSGRPTPGESVEAWARDARYSALAGLARAHGADVVLLGHHRRDQAETLLLQALRGGGTAGLAAMPERVERDGIVWLRPWLRRSGGEIGAYVERHGLTHVDDDSNADRRFARNRLRHDVWPALETAFPQAEAALAVSARWAAEADAALAELAAIDLAALRCGEGLDVGRWALLSPARRSLSLRVWIREAAGTAAGVSLVERLLAELPARRTARWPAAGGGLSLWRGVLRYEPRRDTPADADPEPGLVVHRPGDYVLPGWGGRLRIERVPADGVSLERLARLALKPRCGGESFQAGATRPPRSLKKQFQAAAVPVSDRGGPLVYCGDRLVYVPGLGLDARVVEREGSALVTLHWQAAGRDEAGG